MVRVLEITPSSYLTEMDIRFWGARCRVIARKGGGSEIEKEIVNCKQNLEAISRNPRELPVKSRSNEKVQFRRRMLSISSGWELIARQLLTRRCYIPRQVTSKHYEHSDSILGLLM